MQIVSSILTAGLLLSAANANPIDTRAATCNAADVAIVKANALQPAYFCTYYLSATRTRSALPNIAAADLKAACECIVASAPKTTTNTPLPAVTATSAACVASDLKTLDGKFTSPTYFCDFYNAYPRDQEKMSPVNGLSIPLVQKACRCIKSGIASTSSASASTTAKSSSTTAKSSTTTAKSSSTTVKSSSTTVKSSSTTAKSSSTTAKSSSTTVKSSSTTSKSTGAPFTSSKTSSTTSSTSSNSGSSTSSSSSTTGSSSSTTSDSGSSMSSSSTTSDVSSSSITSSSSLSSSTTTTPSSSSSTTTSTSPTATACVPGPTTNNDGTQWSITCDSSFYGTIGAAYTVANFSMCEARCKRNCAGVAYNPTNRFCKVMSAIDDTYDNTGTTAASYVGYNGTYAAMKAIEAGSFQRFCSTLLSYTITTVTESTTTTLAPQTIVSATTTTEIVAETQYYKHKRSEPLGECNHAHGLAKRGPAATTTTDVLSTPAALTTLAPSDITAGCSAEAHPVTDITYTTTLISTVTPDPVSTVTTVTVTSTTTIAIASNAPTGVVGYLKINPVVDAGSEYIVSDAAGHMTDNLNVQNFRESHIITSSGELYSVTHNSYYYYNSPGGGDLIYWTNSESSASKNWVSSVTSAGTELLMQDLRTAGAYYQLCIYQGEDGGSTGSHVFFFTAGGVPSGCTIIRLFFEDV